MLSQQSQQRGLVACMEAVTCERIDAHRLGGSGRGGTIAQTFKRPGASGLWAGIEAGAIAPGQQLWGEADASTHHRWRTRWMRPETTTLLLSPPGIQIMENLPVFVKWCPSQSGLQDSCYLLRQNHFKNMAVSICKWHINAGSFTTKTQVFRNSPWRFGPPVYPDRMLYEATSTEIYMDLFLSLMIRR